MTKLLENPDYIASHLDKAISLFTGLMSHSLGSRDYASKIIDCLGLLYTKVRMRQSDGLSFDLESGFPIKDEFWQLAVDQRQVMANRVGKEYNYSPEGVRENIITGIDSLPLDDFYESAGKLLDDGVEYLEKYH